MRGVVATAMGLYPLALVLAAFWSAASADVYQEENALLLFKEALEDSMALASWLPQAGSACSGSWRGVGCNQNGSGVVGLTLQGDDFSGPIPDDIRILTFLKNLTIRKTHFLGAIPEAIAELRNLKDLIMSGNPGLSGPFPQWILNLTKLETLNLSGNNLTGSLPGCNSTSVTIGGPAGSVTVTAPIPVLLPFNFSVPGIPLPVVAPVNVTLPLVALPVPVIQNVSFPNLTNVNPPVWAFPPYRLDNPPLNITPTMNWTFPNLTISNPFDNWTMPPLPSLNISAPPPLPDLPPLILSNFTLSPVTLPTLPPLPSILNISLPVPITKPPIGSLPCNDIIDNQSHEQIVHARHLTQSSMALRDNISNEQSFKVLPSLKYLDLSNNAFTGHIPKDLHSLPKLKLVDLSNNELTGSIPSKLLKSKVKSMDVSSNCLTGIVPKKNGKMSPRFTFAQKCSQKSRHCKCRNIKNSQSGQVNRHKGTRA